MNVAIQLGRLGPWLRRDVQATLKRVAEAGFRSVATDGAVEGSKGSGRQELDAAGLSAISVTFNLHDLHGRFEDVVTTAKELGAPWVVIQHLRLDDFGDGWRLMGQRISRWVEELKPHGLRLAYHNHRMEFALDGGRTGLEDLLDGAGPGLAVEFDVLWARKAGQDPVGWLSRLNGRIALVHLDTTCLDENDLCRALVSAGQRGNVVHAVIVPDSRDSDPFARAEAQRRNLVSLGAEA